MKRFITTIALGAAVLACGAAARADITVKGSDTIVILAQKWAETYMGKNPNVKIQVTGGGSGVGLAALQNQSTDIANSSRKIKAPEIANCLKTFGRRPTEYKVAMDGLSVYLNESNPVSELSIEQLRLIFTGKIKNWKEVGGKDSDIVLLSREVNSGTHVYFKEHVLRKGKSDGKEEFATTALMQPSSQSIADEVAGNPKAIGYYGMGYCSNEQKVIAVAKTSAGPYVAPTMDTVIKGTYSISRPLMFYTNGEPSGSVKQYLDFVLGPEGQKIVEEQEFVPVKGAECK